MSAQKLRSSKIIKMPSTDVYSRNPIINTLIKNKLETEMLQVKDSFTNILKKEKQSIPQKPKSKRQRSYSIGPKKIQESLNYDPVSRVFKVVQQFVTERQVDSFLIPREELLKINQARLEPGGLGVKFTKNDKISYKVPANFDQLGQNVRQSLTKQLSHDVWLAEKPEVLNMIINKREEIQQRYTNDFGQLNERQIRNQENKWVKQLIGTEQNLVNRQKLIKPPLKLSGSFRSKSTSNLKTTKKLQKMTQNSIISTQYNYTKYHKDDYKALQSWLDDTLKAVPLLQQKQSIEVKLNTVYSVYMSVWKQMIRFTYIQSCEKALLLQKLFYSTLRLFSNLISQQHISSRNIYRQSQEETKAISDLLQQRCDKLNNNYENTLSELNELKLNNHRLSLAYIVYQKVNKELSVQLQKVSKQKKIHERELYSIGNAYLKTLQILSDKNLIQMEYDKEAEQEAKSSKQKNKKNKPFYKTYYLIGKDNKPLILGRFKSHAEGMDRYASLEEQLKFNNSSQYQRYGKKIDDLQNEINRFWQKKKEDLEMRSIVNSCLINVKIKDIGVGTAQYESSDFSCQFPENSQQMIKKLLDQQKSQLQSKFEAQRHLLQQNIQNKQNLLHKWKLSHDQVQQKCKNSHEANLKLQQNIKKVKDSIVDMKTEIKNLTSQKEQLLKQIQNRQKNIKNLTNQREFAVDAKQRMVKQVTKLQKQAQTQKQNNILLVKSTLNLKQQIQKAKIRYQELLEKVKGIAPWLEKFMAQVDNRDSDLGVDWNMLINVSQKIQYYLREYVQKDSGLFMTKI